jgi:hypothetical protein
MLFKRATLISNVALNEGSSKQGNTRLANAGKVSVAAYQLKYKYFFECLYRV